MKNQHIDNFLNKAIFLIIVFMASYGFAGDVTNKDFIRTVSTHKEPMGFFNKYLIENKNGAEFFVPEQKWKSQLIDITVNVDNKIPGTFPRVGNLNIVYAPSTMSAAYLPILTYTSSSEFPRKLNNTMILGKKLNEPIVVHEYGHLLLDKFLNVESEHWKFYSAWMVADREKIGPKLAQLEKGLHNSERKYAEKFTDLSIIEKCQIAYNDKGYSELVFDCRIIINYINRISDYKQKIAALNLAQEIQNKYDYNLSVKSDYKGNGKDVFKELTPYFELFSDYLAAVILKQWDSIGNVALSEYQSFAKMILTDKNNKPLDGATLPEYAFHRNFPTDMEFNEYQFEGWEEKSNYTQFLKVRHYLRKNTSNESHLLLELANAIKKTLETRIYPSFEEYGMEEKNDMLIQYIEEQL
ncbi:MAG: hypothetical protein HOO06_04690 [Bdellovibrionaceae bacterium]|jgi:hypothetical protein|nr:hypothetical protein [Pseudobdellovibrionaceae bacterium]